MSQRRSMAALAALTGALVLASPASSARAGDDPARDWLPAALAVQPKPGTEKLDAGIELPPRPEAPSASGARASSRQLCRLGVCLRVGQEDARAGVPTPPLQGVLDWSTPTNPPAPHFVLVSISREPRG